LSESKNFYSIFFILIAVMFVITSPILIGDVHGMEDEIIEIENDILENRIREVVNKPEGAVYLDDIKEIRELHFDPYLPEHRLNSFTGIEYLVNLEELSFAGYGIKDLSPLTELTNLKSLEFGAWEPTRIDDLSPLGKISSLERLVIGANITSDISPIGNLGNLVELRLWRSIPEGDISFLADLENLIILNIADNRIEDISALSNLKNLRELNLGLNQIYDISALENLINLETLVLGGSHEGVISTGNKIEDISSISSLTNLGYLTLDDNRISDITPLVENCGFGEGDKIDLRHNYLDLTPGSEDMSNINILIDRGVEVSYEPQK